MKTNSDYQNYIATIQNYEISNGGKDYQTPFVNDFQEIYKQAKESKVETSDVENFASLNNSLDVDPLSADVDKFLYDLLTKGAAKFLADLNQEKIDKLVEEYREKLIENMEDSPEAMLEIEKLVEEFKKQLIEEMREKTEEEAKQKSPNNKSISSNSFVNELINLQNKKTIKPLEELLKI